MGRDPGYRDTAAHFPETIPGVSHPRVLGSRREMVLRSNKFGKFLLKLCSLQRLE